MFLTTLKCITSRFIYKVRVKLIQYESKAPIIYTIYVPHAHKKSNNLYCNRQYIVQQSCSFAIMNERFGKHCCPILFQLISFQTVSLQCSVCRSITKPASFCGVSGIIKGVCGYNLTIIHQSTSSRSDILYKSNVCQWVTRLVP